MKLSGLDVSRFYGIKNSSIPRESQDAKYEAPEIAAGKAYTAKSDIYSYSIILWEIAHKCLSGIYNDPYQAYSGLDENDLYSKISNQNLRPTISGLCPEVVSSIIRKCMYQCLQNYQYKLNTILRLE